MAGARAGGGVLELFAGTRGRFLATIMLAELGAAMQGIAYSTVLPVVAADLDGSALFGATLAAGNIAAVLMLSVTGAVLGRVRPSRVLLAGVLLYVVGVGLAVAAPTMAWVLAGTAVRGIAAGLLGGFGTSAIGALYDERERPRVFGIFAFVWILPSIVGPALNAVVTEAVGWRWAVAWPAILVVGARLLMGRYVKAVPWTRGGQSTQLGTGLLVAAGLAVGAWGSGHGGPVGATALVVGLVVAAGGFVAFVVRGSAHDRAPVRALLAFGVTCAAFFGMYELLALAVVEGLDQSLWWASASLTGGLLGWSIAGLRPRPAARPDRALVGVLLVLAGVAGVVVALAGPHAARSLALVVGFSIAAGIGMGLAYPLLSAAPFDVSAPERTTVVGPQIAFAEVAGTAWATLLGGGAYSLAAADHPPARAVLVAYLAVSVVAIAAVVTVARRRISPLS
ncbi:MFS transporter [Cellulomonas rhizosphaerae]|uniref:MFS transporter n=1 Tax=Cellulomonas rhizosphaerae TaxID=2293719 RepID=A0A413RH25_9CELL|nr:MFS transporter [Cellulomonas rhizosphaerae]RHA37100.1 MFS transporter [Cellulomonas rhizosphaerae]